MNNQFSNQSYNISILQDLSYIITCIYFGNLDLTLTFDSSVFIFFFDFFSPIQHVHLLLLV